MILSESRGAGMSSRGGNRLVETRPSDYFLKFRLFCFFAGFEAALEGLRADVLAAVDKRWYGRCSVVVEYRNLEFRISIAVVFI